MSTAEIIESVRKLRAAERLEVVEAILDSLDEPDAAVDAAWAAEAQDRRSAYLRGELPLSSLEPVLAKYR